MAAEKWEIGESVAEKIAEAVFLRQRTQSSTGSEVSHAKDQPSLSELWLGRRNGRKGIGRRVKDPASA